jgi:hypothetical protein
VGVADQGNVGGLEVPAAKRWDHGYLQSCLGQASTHPEPYFCSPPQALPSQPTYYTIIS